MPETMSDHRPHRLAGGSILNPRLVLEQALDAPRIARLQALHAEMHALYERFADAPADAIPALRAEVQRVEFEMQDAWGWERDASRHSHWSQVPGCTCPSQLNWSLFGQGVRFVAEACPVHPVTEDVPGVRVMPFKEIRRDVASEGDQPR